MRINNVSSKTSLQGISIVAVFTILMTAGFIIFYVNTSLLKISVWGFFEWYVSILQNILDSSDSDKWAVAAGYVLLPVGLYIGLIAMVVSRKMTILKQSTMLTLKYVDFLPDRINFKFNKPQYNFVCGYSDVKSLKMNLISVIVHSKYGSYPALKEIELDFKLSNGKEFSILNTPFLSTMGFVYRIVDYGRRINKFSYRFSGAGEPSGIREKIEDYKNKGLRQILSKPQENACKAMSMTFFLMGCYFIYAFKDEIPDLIGDSGIWIILTMPVVLMIMSFICDAFLVADKMREKRFR